MLWIPYNTNRKDTLYGIDGIEGWDMRGGASWTVLLSRFGRDCEVSILILSNRNALTV